MILIDTWMCLQCGTNNEDSIDWTIEEINKNHLYDSPLADHLETLLERKRSYEERGEKQPENCKRCGEVRPL